MTGTFGNGASGASPPDVASKLLLPPAPSPDFRRYFPKNAPHRRTAPLGTTFKNITSPETKDALRLLRKRLAEKPKKPTTKPRDERAKRRTT